MHACIGDTGQLERSDENLVRSSGTGVTGSYEPHNMGARDSGPLEECSLAAESSFQDRGPFCRIFPSTFMWVRRTELKPPGLPC